MPCLYRFGAKVLHLFSTDPLSEALRSSSKSYSQVHTISTGQHPTFRAKLCPSRRYIEARKSSTPAEDAMTDDVNSPVAILDKDLAKYPSYTIETFELCDCCGARFAIGYHQQCKSHAAIAR